MSVGFRRLNTQQFELLNGYSNVSNSNAMYVLPQGDEGASEGVEIPTGPLEISIYVGGGLLGVSSAKFVTANSVRVNYGQMPQNGGLPVLFYRSGSTWTRVEKQNIRERSIVAQINRYGYYQVFTPAAETPLSVEAYVQPNPVVAQRKATLVVRTPSRVDGISVRVYGIDGELLLKKDEADVSTTNPEVIGSRVGYRLEIDLDHATSGVYLGKVSVRRDREASGQTFKFTIVK